MTDFLTTAEAARALGIDRSRVLRLITLGRLPATRFGRAWMITATDLDAVRERPTGYPKGRPRTVRSG